MIMFVKKGDKNEFFAIDTVQKSKEIGYYISLISNFVYKIQISDLISAANHR